MSATGALVQRLAAAAGFLVCATLAFIAVSSVELRSNPAAAADLPAALGYLTRLSWRASLYGSAAVLALHAVRVLLLRFTRFGDLVLCAGLLALLWRPALEQAQLLASGSQIAESEHAEQLRVLFLGALLASHLALWLLHLALCGAWRRPDAKYPIGRFVAAFTLGALALAGLVFLENAFRQYAFLTRFLLPATWFLAATLLTALYLRLPDRARYVGLVSAGALLLALATVVTARPAQRRAQGAFMRTGAIAGIADQLVYPQKRVGYANIDLSRPKRFKCPPEAPYQPVAPLPTPKDKRRNVILVSVDALRKDVVGMRERGRAVTPALEQLARKGVVFERAVTTYPATLFALGSALTGQSSSQVLFAPRAPDNIFRLAAEHVDERFISLPMSAWFRKRIVKRLFTQDVIAQRHGRAAAQTTWLIDRLTKARRENQSVLAWVHYYEPHSPHKAQPGFDFGADPRGNYLSEVASVDAQLGKLNAYLEQAGYYDDSLVLLFSDHGEALGEQGYYGHHVFLNSWITDIPLVMRAPGLPAGRDQRLAEISDIAPTVLHFLGAEQPAIQARSLFDAPDPKRYGFAEAFPLRGSALFSMAKSPITDAAELRERMLRVRLSTIDYLPKVAVASARHRLIVNRVTGAEELYDRKQDPLELRDLSDQGLGTQRKLRNALRDWTTEQSRSIYCRVRAADRRAASSAPSTPPSTPRDTPPSTPPSTPPNKPSSKPE